MTHEELMTGLQDLHRRYPQKHILAAIQALCDGNTLPIYQAVLRERDALQARVAELEVQNVCFVCGGPGVQHWCEQHRPSLLRAPVVAKPPFTQEQTDRGAAVYRALTGKRDDRDSGGGK